MKIAVLQMCAGFDPAVNAAHIEAMIADAAAEDAIMLFTPEMSGMIDRNAKRARPKIVTEAEDVTLGTVRAAARDHAIWVQLGSLAIDSQRPDGRIVNRSFVIDSSGDIRARYDKIHLFDVDLPTGERWRESASYAPGDKAAVVGTPLGTLGLSVCYDLRFPALYAALTAAGASVLSIPAAFTVPTGQAHWHVLQRARAIESATFVVAAAQTGTHADGRATYGHSLVISPWGDVLLDMGTEPGLAVVDIDLAQVGDVRARIPVLVHRRAIAVP